MSAAGFGPAPVWGRVAPRPIPGWPGFVISQARTVWRNRTPPGLPPPWDQPCWERLRPKRRAGEYPAVALRAADGRFHYRSVELLYHAAWSPDPSAWEARIGPRSRRVTAVEPDPSPPDHGDDGIAAAPPAEFPPTPVDEAGPVPVGARPEPGPIPSGIEPGPDPAPILYRDLADWPGYRIGLDGSAWSCKVSKGRGVGMVIGGPPAWRRLSVRSRGRGGGEVTLYRGGRKTVRAIARLLRETFTDEELHPPVELPEGAPEAVRGSANGRARLDEEKVIEARRLHREGWSYQALCARYGIGRVTLHYALVGKTWGHVPME